MIETTNAFQQKKKKEYGSIEIYTILEDIFKGLANAKTLDGIVLKGGFLLVNTLSNSRLTRDKDFSIDKKIGWKNLLQAIHTSVDGLGQDFFIFKVREPMEAMSGKIEIKQLSSGRVIGIDASWEPIEVGAKQTNILGVKIDTYTICHILADKYCAIHSERRFRRPKDLYDVYNILLNYDVSYKEFDDVVEHCRNKIDWSETPITDAVAEKYKENWDTLDFSVLKTDTMEKKEIHPDFGLLYGKVCSFLLEYKLWKKAGMQDEMWSKEL